MTMRAFLFPGQGSQYVGMGKDLYEHFPIARMMFDKADDILGLRLSVLCFSGPEDELKQTNNTQPAIFVHSVIAASLLKQQRKDETAAMAAGHSLGEYSALVAAGALTFEDGLRLVRIRGELMQEAGVRQPGTMAAVIGLEPAALEDVCAEASAQGVVVPANFNSPEQIVISGSVGGVRKAMELAKASGAKLVKELQVSGAFHSPLMEFAQDGLKNALNTVTFHESSVPVYANVTGAPATKPEEFRQLLLKQLTSPVRWTETLRAMEAAGATEFVEIGPGKVLQGLAKKTMPAVPARGISTAQDILA